MDYKKAKTTYVKGRSISFITTVGFDPDKVIACEFFDSEKMTCTKYEPNGKCSCRLER